jgi:dienelactone hydrolase
MVGTTVAQYRILERLGEGGMGIVYKAQDLKLDRTVALKFLLPDLTRDPEAKQRFIHEAKAASTLDHPNVCTVHDISETEDGQIFIVMACYHGETLREKIERGPVPIAEGLSIALQIARGLARAHERGIVHRDIKPANIFLSSDGIVRILDFGLAKLSGQSRITREGSTLGTAAYMSPEQARGDEVDQRTDIWSFGGVLYEMFTGRMPFTTEYPTALVYAILNEDPRPPSRIRSELGEALEAVILRCLAKDPSARFAAGGEVVAALASLVPSEIAQASEGRPRTRWRQVLRRPLVIASLGAAVLALVAGGAWLVDRRANVSRAREELLPQIRTALQGVPFNVPLKEFALAQEARAYIGDEPEFADVWEKISSPVSVRTDPPGATVQLRHVGTPGAVWVDLGLTPVEQVVLPRRFVQMRITRPGYVVRDDVVLPFFTRAGVFVSADFDIVLDSLGSIPEGMAWVYGDTLLGNFLIDRCEVTNSQYREFVRAGGYRDSSFWHEPFIEGGRTLPWHEAMQRFVDATGRPGPSSWRAGSYPDGEDTYPVRGLSWYEAGAYAAFVGKRLPTVEHWALASMGGEDFWTLYFDQYIVPASNFSDTGPRPVGSGDLFGPYGLWDMAGNVREWCWNESIKGRCLRGGAWNDATYMYRDVTQAAPFDRSERNGFRCMVLPPGVKLPADVFDPVSLEGEYDLRTVKQVPDDVFRIYRDRYEYDRIPLEPIVELHDESSDDWVMEKVSFTDLSPDERMSAYLFLPKNAVPPFQSLVYFPGSWAEEVASSRELDRQAHFIRSVQYLVKSGRAVVHPITVGMYERSLPDSLRRAMGPHQLVDFRVRLVREYRRTLDYLESRADVDANRLAYYGMSWGGNYANMILAVETRFRAAIVEVGGLNLEPNVVPEVRMLYYTPHITLPVLMLNGEYDLSYTLELNVKPMFEMLGTPARDKRLIVYPTDHFIPANEFLKESLAWLDKYLGPVKYK